MESAVSLMSASMSHALRGSGVSMECVLLIPAKRFSAQSISAVKRVKASRSASRIGMKQRRRRERTLERKLVLNRALKRVWTQERKRERSRVWTQDPLRAVR